MIELLDFNKVDNEGDERVGEEKLQGEKHLEGNSLLRIYLNL